jgi:hypothetical protein
MNRDQQQAPLVHDQFHFRVGVDAQETITQVRPQTNSAPHLDRISRK